MPAGSTTQFHDYPNLCLTMATIHILTISLMLLCGARSALAGRRYIAIPIDGLDVIELNAVGPTPARIARQTETYVPVAIQQDGYESPRAERSAGQIYDYVDFGGHTGSNGAYSWYADYPSHH